MTKSHLLALAVVLVLMFTHDRVKVHDFGPVIPAAHIETWEVPR